MGIKSTVSLNKHIVSLNDRLKKVNKKFTKHALTLFAIIQLYLQSDSEACSGEN